MENIKEEYDCCIFSRYDILFDEKLDLEKYVPNMKDDEIYVPQFSKIGDHCGIPDVILFGKYETIKKTLFLYDSMKPYFEEGYVLQSESNYMKLFEYESIKLMRFPLNASLNPKRHEYAEIEMKETKKHDKEYKNIVNFLYKPNLLTRQ